MQKTCIILAGPTAVGKTDIAIALAKQRSTEIISADSRQCYKELNIGTAKPSPAQLSAVHHYFVDELSVEQAFSAADYEAYALKAVADVFSRHDVAVMCGGTGLYIKAFSEGLDEVPPVTEEITEAVKALFQSGGISALQAATESEDPAFFRKGEIDNPHRVMRALSVMRGTGKSLLSFHSATATPRAFRIIKLCLEVKREELYERINARVDAMMRAGLEEEARGLFAKRHLNALQTVGYRELFAYFEGKISLPEAIGLIKQNTRHYAKRQMTWFKKDAAMTFVNAAPETVLAKVEELL